MLVERSGTIKQPLERVFEYVSTPENDPTWVPASLRHQKISPGPLRVGSITEEDVAFLGRRMRCVWEVCHYEPPSAVALRTVSGPLPATIHLLLESVDSATELTLVVDAELRGVYKLMEPLMKWVVQRQFKTQLHTLKNLLESGTVDNARAG
jgi:Polyketide cyclase / dehydrase and lipid transport